MTIKLRYYHLLDVMSGGHLYHARWMSKLGIPRCRHGRSRGSSTFAIGVGARLMSNDIPGGRHDRAPRGSAPPRGADGGADV
jgi:hypothetical protein